MPRWSRSQPIATTVLRRPVVAPPSASLAVTIYLSGVETAATMYRWDGATETALTVERVP